MPKRPPAITTRRQAILDDLGDEETVMFLEPPLLDRAIVGVSWAQPGRPRVVIYDYEQLVRCFMTQGMSREDAEEWMDFNTLGAWMGDETPVVMSRLGRR